MDRIKLFFDTFWSWTAAFYVFSGIISERVRQAWKNRDKLPYKWSCVDCIEQNMGEFRCSSNEIRSLDAMILKHKEQLHSGP